MAISDHVEGDTTDRAFLLDGLEVIDEETAATIVQQPFDRDVLFKRPVGDSVALARQGICSAALRNRLQHHLLPARQVRIDQE